MAMEQKLKIKSLGENGNSRGVYLVLHSYMYETFNYFLLFIFFVLCLIVNIKFLILLIIIFIWYIIYFLPCRTVEESLLLLQNIGLQYSLKKPFYGYQNDIFIHWNDIDSIIIREAFLSQKVIYTLTVLTKNGSGENYLLPLFMITKPKIKYLEIIYQECHAILKKKKNHIFLHNK